jgi:cell division protein FtsI/penicillin-binding protein 2
MITVLPPEQALLAGAKSSPVGSLDNLSAQDMLLHFGAKARQAAQFYYVGNKVIINNRTNTDEGSGQVRLMGYRMPVGRLAWLETGDWLYLEALQPTPVKETFIFDAGETRPVASAVRKRNDKDQRIFTKDPMLGWYIDQEGQQPIPFLEMLARRIDQALNHISPERARALLNSFDLQLSLRRDLQDTLSSKFHTIFDEIRHRHHRGQPFPAGITIMDGKSGEILAMTTYPWPDDLSDTVPGIDAQERRNLLRNQNLVRHPIGSAFKPFLYAAITQTFPSLGTLKINAHRTDTDFKQLLQCRLENGYQVIGISQPVDLPTALARSSNRFTAELATLALAPKSAEQEYRNIQDLLPPDPDYKAWPTPTSPSGISVLGQELRYAPNLRERIDLGERIDGRPPSCNTLKPQFEQVKFSSALEDITGADAYLGKAPQGLPEKGGNDIFYESYQTHNYDLSAWRSLIKHLSQGLNEDNLWTVRSDFKGVSPESVNLAFNQIHRLRQDYITLILGGGNCIWTNIQLAEAMSRLVTDKPLEATLVSVVLDKNGQPVKTDTAQSSPVSSRLLRPEVRKAVLTGITRVVTDPGGPAGGLRSTLGQLRKQYPKDHLWLFSKTGTPTLEVHVPKPLGQALEALVTRSYLRFQDGALHVRVGNRTQSYRDAGFYNLLLQALRKVNPSSALAERERRRIAARLMQILVRFDRNVSSDSLEGHAQVPDSVASPLGPLHLDGGSQLRVNREHRLFSDFQDTSQGAVYVFSLVRIPNSAGQGSAIPDPEQLARPDTKVITVALHLNMGKDSKFAVERIAKRILEEINLLELIQKPPEQDN